VHLFVKKKSGDLRMCVDYRALNALTVKNRFPLPRIDDLFDKLQGAQWFTYLDLTQGYNQIQIPEEDRPKTAFRTPLGHYQFKVLCFGLTNAPATFQAVMNDVLREVVRDGICLVYMDDILIFGKTAEEHKTHVRRVLELLQRHRLYANRKKCSFFQREVNFLGHVINADGVTVDPAKTAAVKDWPRPSSVAQVRSFLGLSNYFRKFLMGYSNLVRHLTNLTRKSAKWEWTQDCEDAFQGVKSQLTSAPVLALPEVGEGAPPFTVL